MSVETCSIHLNYLFLYRHPVLVAEESGEIVGEVEALISEEHFLGKIRKICHVEVLIVKESHSRQEGHLSLNPLVLSYLVALSVT